MGRGYSDRTGHPEHQNMLQREWNSVSCDSSVFLEGAAGEVSEVRQGRAKGEMEMGTQNEPFP